MTATLTTATFEVYLNVAQDEQGRSLGYDGYQPGHALVHAATLTVDAGSLDAALNRAYELLNIGDDPMFGTPDSQAVAYRARRNRSLSVGDVLMADGAALAVASCGFEPVRVDPTQITAESTYGATSID